MTRYILTSISLVSLILSCQAICVASSHILSAPRLLNDLKLNDNSLAEYRIVYEANLLLAGRHGYHESCVFDTASSLGGSGKFDIDIVAGSGAIVSMDDVYDNTVDVKMLHGAKQADISGPQSQYWNLMRAMEVAPGPCFALGRGLSSLTSPVLAGTSLSPVISGIAMDGSPVKATLDPLHGFVASKIVVYLEGTPLGIWHLSRFFMLPRGIWIASSARYDPIILTGSNACVAVIVHRNSCRLSKAPDFDMSWSEPGTTILDERLGSIDTVPFNSSMVIQAAHRYHMPVTLGTLLTFTHHAIVVKANEQAQNDTLSAQRHLDSVIVSRGVPLLCVFTAITIYYIRSRVVRSSPPAEN